jgi:hypothetical protein
LFAGRAYNSRMLKIHCSGLTVSEVKELKALLKTRKDIGKVDMIPGLAAMNRRSLPMDCGAPVFWVVANISSASVIAGKALIGEASNGLYKSTRDWLAHKFPQKTVREIEVNFYGPDGRIIEHINR